MGHDDQNPAFLKINTIVGSAKKAKNLMKEMPIALIINTLITL